MAFVNEYISEEDAKKCNYFDLKNNYNLKRVTRYPYLHPQGSYKYDWVVDKERDIFFFMAGHVYETSWTDRPTPSGVEIYILSIEGNLIELELFLGEETSKNYKSDPCILAWEIQKIKNLSNLSIDKNTIVNVLAEILPIYVRRGLHINIQNPQVSLKTPDISLKIEKNMEG